MTITLNGTTGITSPGGDVSVSQSLSGNLTFTGTGNRITGDFSNATLANRVMFQTSTANATTIVGVLPSGTGTEGRLTILNNSDPTLSSGIDLRSITTEAMIRANNYGGGSLPMTFYTGGSERMRIDTSGNVGIGTSSPTYQTQIYGTGQTTAALTDAGNKGGSIFLNTPTVSAGDGGALLLGAGGTGSKPFAAVKGLLVDGGGNTTGSIAFSTRNATGDTALTERMRIDSSGNVSINRTAGLGGSKFLVKASTTGTGAWVTYTANTVDGLLFGVLDNGGISTGTFTNSPYNLTTGSAANAFLESDGLLKRSTSSLRYKTDVQDAAHGLAEVMALRPVTYKGKNDGDKVFGGLIAEEVDEAGLTEFVVYDKEGRPDALHYGNMVSLAFKAIQELKAELDTVKAELATLKGN